MSSENKEFYDLLDSIVNDQSFDLELTPNQTPETIKCKQLSTAQLKELIKAVVDSPLTQSAFNSTASKVFKESIVSSPVPELNVVDRLLFLIETRIQSLSPTSTVTRDDKEIKLDFEQIKQTLQKNIKENANLFASKSVQHEKITVEVCVPLLATETQLNEELYKNANINVEDADQLRKVLGEAFINEIAKSIKTLTIQDKTLDLSTVTFKSRLKTVESLPASLIQKVIEYIEGYKKVVDQALTVDGYLIPIDGSLFSVR
jgi:hypothetical protein